MKKICSLALALALLLGLSVPALAGETMNEVGTSSPISVTGNYISNTSSETVYSVDIAWENMTFAYHSADKTWNPNDHDYTGSSGGSGYWEDSNATITVTNHSNAFLSLQCNYAPENGFENADMAFSCSNCDYRSPSVGIVCSAELNNTQQSTKITVTPTGTLPESTPAGAHIGNITVTIAKWEEPNTEVASSLALSATSKLDELSENDEEYGPLQTAISTLNNAISEAENGDRSHQLAMLEAYIELSTIMANLTTKSDTSTL